MSCCNPKAQQIEFKIEEKENTSIYIQDYFPEKDLCALKYKTINDFSNILTQLSCGIQPSLEFLLEEISLIYIYEEQ